MAWRMKNDEEEINTQEQEWDLNLWQLIWIWMTMLSTSWLLTCGVN